MTSSIVKHIVPFVFIGIVLVSSIGCSVASTNCDKPGDLEISRIDERNERIFVIVDSKSLDVPGFVNKLLENAKRYITSCKKEWSNGWSVSIFSDAKYSGYKDDPKLRQYVMDGSWEKAYLAEYDNGDMKLTLYPLLPNRKNESNIKL